MLSNKERKVLGGILDQLQEKNSLLISPSDLLKVVNVENLSLSQLDKIVEALKMDGYFDLVYSDRHGEKIYCIVLAEKGKGYDRSVKVLKRTLIFKVGVTVCLAVLSFLIGLVLKKIF